MNLPHGNSQKVFGIYNSLQMAGLLAALALGLTEVKIGDKERDRAHGGAVQFRTVLRQTICCKELLLFLIALAFLAEAHQTITVFLNQLQYEKCGLDNAAIGYIYIIATLLGGAAVIACVMLVFALTAFVSVSGILLLRLSNSLFLSFQTEMQNKLVYTQYRATELSIHAMVLDSIDSIAVGTNLVFGAMARISLVKAFWFGAGICTASIILFYSSIRRAGDVAMKQKHYE
ncbi:hypothetical protein IMSAGC005_02508 [Lachnospiraceae bacterium]|nr:hypothetical protein IMSAGC005_02508 [Lachnospiraceae bacterium]